ncbi:Rhodanese-like domain-containing protein [Zopfochytrium polystomum]|nr:Rhodanese-like domain-containing protein [Zopfochytrium polystomum]
MTSSRASGSSYAHWSNRSAKTTSAASKPKPTTVLAVPIRTDEQLTSLAKKRERNQISTRGLLVPTPDSAPSRHHAKNSDKEPRTSPRPSQAGLERKDCAVSPRVKQRKISGGSLHQSEQECPLPTMQTGQDAFKRISCVTLSDLLQGKYAGKVDNFVIIDCRFPYEFEGGHIQGAINVTTTSHLETLFFSEKRGQDTAIILHCEFSAQRAPKMALHLRNHDRNVNVEQYPKLDYPHIFIVQGGYKEFFSRFETHCEPKGYISMDDVRYRDELKQYLSQHKSEFKRCYSTGFLRT